MTESVSVATFITETSTTDHASSSIAEAAQELSENVSEITLRNMQVRDTTCTKHICTDTSLSLSLPTALGVSSARAVGTAYDSGHN